MKILFGLLLFWSTRNHAIPIDTTQRIEKLMQILHQRGQYNGSILVAVQGRIIYRNGFGESNFGTHEKFTPATISCLASVSKQFTSMLIMMLAEQNKIQYDHPVSKFIPEIATYANRISIRHLLTHTSGIPDVGDLGIDHPGLTNDEVLKTLTKQNSFVFPPGTKYQYSNTGYILLAIIIERITGRPFKEYLTEKIIAPLKMTNTFFYDGTQFKSNQVAIGYNQFGQKDDDMPLKATGFGGMYSTVDDLFQWDKALYSEKLISQSALETAFTPAKVLEGKTTYGFGWNILESGGDKIVWHTGNTAGFRAYIERRLKDRITIIMLTNKGNSRRREISEAIVNIIKGLSFQLPKLPISETIYNSIATNGIEFALKMYDSLETSKNMTYDFSESELNTLGYQLLSENRKSEAVKIFKLNTFSYPGSSNAFDSLGDAYVETQHKDSAILSYQKAVDLDKNNIQSLQKLNRLKKIN